MNFVAFDFETANSKRSSACALGIAVVQDNKVVERKSWLIKPKDLYFDWYNVSIHKITAEDVKNENEFNEIWEDVKPYLDNKIVMAHNASFDISVLKGLADEYNFELPEMIPICTRKLSRKLWPGLFSYKLYTVAKRHLKINFKYHDPSDDAYACAMIAIKAIEELNIKTEEELFNVITPTLKKKHSHLNVKDIKTDNIEFDEDNPFFQKTVAFTGTLESMTRREALQKVADIGGICGNSITKSTNYLVVGIQDFNRLVNGDKSSKMIKAEKLIEEGNDLEIITEDEFLDMI